MKIYTFTIQGNHKSLTGNPMPKLKMTGRQQWTPRAREYVAWKSHVIECFMHSLIGKDVRDQRAFSSNVARFGKPFATGTTDQAFMYIRIYWSNRGHGDPENIFGSIADALFKNDKNLDCLTISSMTDRKVGGKPEGRVEVLIQLFPSEDDKVRSVKADICKC